MLCILQCIDNPLIMFWNMDLSRLHLIWAITLICKYTWFNYSSEKNWKIHSCSWLTTVCLSTILQNSFLGMFFIHGVLGNSSQLSHHGNQDIHTQASFLFSTSTLFKLPWQWESCSFYFGERWHLAVFAILLHKYMPYSHLNCWS